MEWVWPEETPEPQNRVQTLHSYATRIRQCLQHVQTPVTLTSGAGSYRLDVDHTTIDYYRFRSLMTTARDLLNRGEYRSARKTALDAVGLWRGLPLEELNTERARNWRHRVLTNEWLPANNLLVTTELALGHFEAALARIDELLAEYPHDLALTKARIASLRGLARFDDALAHYLDTYRRLQHDGNEQAAKHLRRFFEDNEVVPCTTTPGPVVAAPESSVPRQLPHDPPDFVGREHHLATLHAAIGGEATPYIPAALLIDGMAGVGKTALAIHWAHQVRHRVTDGDLYVNLNGFSDDAKVDPGTVVDDFLAALGHPPDTAMPRRARRHQLSRLLAGRRILVILDNARNSAHVQDLVALMSGCIVIVTSRQRLTKLSAATGARTISVDPLALDDTAALLAIRLGNRRTLSPPDNARLAGLSGGLPLVVSLLAEHLAAGSTSHASELAHQLNHRDLLLEVGEDGDAPISAHAVFSSSYRALSAAEQRLFRLLGLHPNADISTEVATALDDRTTAETKRSLRALAGAHLIEQPAEPNHYRLHDLLHEFAAYRSEHDERPDIRHTAERRVLDYYLGSARTAHRLLYPSHQTAPDASAGRHSSVLSDTTDAKNWLARQRANVVAAIRMAATRGHHDLAWRLADAVATHFDAHGHYHDGLTVRELAVTSARQAGHREAEGSCLVDLGIAYLILGDNTQARQSLQAARQLAEADHNDQGLACTLHQLARLEVATGDPMSAIPLYQHSLEIQERLGDKEGLCWSHCRLGEALRMADQADAALVHLHDARWLAQSIGAQSAHARSTALIGAILHDRGQDATAEAQCRQALHDAEQIPDLALTAQICTTLATITNAQGMRDTAIDYANRAVAVCQRTGNVIDEAHALHTIGDIHAARGDFTDALPAWRRARDLYEHTGNIRRVHILQAQIDVSSRAVINVPQQTNGESARLEPRSE